MGSGAERTLLKGEVSTIYACRQVQLQVMGKGGFSEHLIDADETIAIKNLETYALMSLAWKTLEKM